MGTRHKWADVIIALANGEEIEYLSDGEWKTPTMNNPIDESYLEWRIKPRTIKVGDMEVPEPLKGLPTSGDVFIADPLSTDLYSKTSAYISDGYDQMRLKRGLLHLTKEAAIAHAKALIAVSGGKV